MASEQSYGVTSFLGQADAVGIAVLLILLVMSIACWYLIILKSVRNTQMRRRVRDSLDSFWGAPSIEAVAAQFAQEQPQDPFARVAAEWL